MSFDFKQRIKMFTQLKQDLPKQIANDGQRFYLKSFDSESWDGQRWRPRTAYGNKTGVRSRKSGRFRTDVSGRKLLIGSPNGGSLRRAVAGMKREQTWKRIRFEVFVQSKSGFNYAEVHNEGIPPQPRRRFLGFNSQLDAIIRKRIQTEVKKVMQ